MIPTSQLSNLNYDAKNKIDYDCLDEFIRQILSAILGTPESIIGGTETKPILRNYKLIHTYDFEVFNNDINSLNTEVYISVERDFNNSNRREESCTNYSSPTYNIYVRMPIDGVARDVYTNPVFNIRQRLTQIIDTLILLLTSPQNEKNGYITSVINTDINNADPTKGKKYITNLKLNSIEKNCPFVRHPWLH